MRLKTNVLSYNLKLHRSRVKLTAMELKNGMSSFEVSQTIVENYPEIAEITLISHFVDLNWRQKYKNIGEKKANLVLGLDHGGVTGVFKFFRPQYQKLKIIELAEKLGKHEVLSFCSKVKLANGEYKHIPMMNFHPEDGTSLEYIISAVKTICGDEIGAILETGRYYHYWGNFLLSQEEWLKFLADFLMPTYLVSPRYIGHRLYIGECTLRMTNDDFFKPKIPQVINVISGEGIGTCFRSVGFNL